jgi:hypothetical protein
MLFAFTPILCQPAPAAGNQGRGTIFFTISATVSELAWLMARCGAPADRAVRSAGSVDSVGHSRDKACSIHDWACAFIGNRVGSKVSKHIIAA